MTDTTPFQGIAEKLFIPVQRPGEAAVSSHPRRREGEDLGPCEPPRKAWFSNFLFSLSVYLQPAVPLFFTVVPSLNPFGLNL